MKKRRVRIITKLAVVVFIVYAAIMLVDLRAKLNDKTAQTHMLAEQVEGQTVANAALSEAIDSEWSDAYYARIAREKLGLSLPGETVMVDISQK